MSRTFRYPASGSTDASSPGAYWYQMGTISGPRPGPADTDKAAMCGSAKNSSRSRTDNLLSAMSLSVGRGTDNPGRAAFARRGRSALHGSRQGFQDPLAAPLRTHTNLAHTEPPHGQSILKVLRTTPLTAPAPGSDRRLSGEAHQVGAHRLGTGGPDVYQARSARMDGSSAASVLAAGKSRPS